MLHSSSTAAKDDYAVLQCRQTHKITQLSLALDINLINPSMSDYTLRSRVLLGTCLDFSKPPIPKFGNIARYFLNCECRSSPDHSSSILVHYIEKRSFGNPDRRIFFYHCAEGIARSEINTRYKVNSPFYSTCDHSTSKNSRNTLTAIRFSSLLPIVTRNQPSLPCLGVSPLKMMPFPSA